MWIVSQLSTIPVGLALLCGFILSVLFAGFVSSSLSYLCKEQEFIRNVSRVIGPVLLFFIFVFVVFPFVTKIYEETETHQSLFIKTWLTVAIVILGSNLFYGMKKITSKIFNQNGVKTIGLDETVKSQRPITKIISCAYALCLCYCIYIVWSKT
jgi:uncharacterized membrane protein